MEEAPGDANGGERLHHFEVTGGGGPSQSQSFEVNEKRDGAGDRGEKKKRDDGSGQVSLSGWWPKRNAIQFSIDEKNERHAYQSDHDAHTCGEAQWHSDHRAATGHSGKPPEQRADKCVTGSHVQSRFLE